MSIKRPGPDHMGFHVENLEAFKKHVAEVAGMPIPISRRCRWAAARNPTCASASSRKHATGKWQMTDPDGNWLDITDE